MTKKLLLPLAATAALTQSFSINNHVAPSSTRIVSFPSSASVLSSTTEDLEITTATQQQQIGEGGEIPHVIARGDGSSGGGGVPMKRKRHQQQKLQQLQIIQTKAISAIISTTMMMKTMTV